MGQRRAQHSPTAEGGRKAGHHFYGNVRVILRQFQHRAGHAVNACVAAAHHHHAPAGIRLFQRPAAAVDLLRHAGGIIFLTWELRLDQVKIKFIAADGICVFQNVLGFLRQVVNISGANANHVDYLFRFVDLKFHRVKHSATSSPGHRAARPAQRSRRYGHICEKRVSRLRPALPTVHRHCPRR